MTAPKDFVVDWADRAESALKKGRRLPPPGEIFDYLDLLGRGWGWDRLAPYSGSNGWPAYKKYLKEYYCRNRAESFSQSWPNEKDDGAAVKTPHSSLHEQEGYAGGNCIREGGILVPLISLCIKMETQFISECEKQGKTDQTADYIVLSDEIRKHALSLKDMEGEFPVAAAALMFITKKAELMCEWMRLGDYNPDSKVTEVRRCALRLMMYTGSDSDCAAAVLVGISKETKMIYECLRQGKQVETIPWSKAIMENGWDILLLLQVECISSCNGNGTATKERNATQMSKDMGNLAVEKYSGIGPDSLIDMRELAVEWTIKVQAYLNKGSMLLPPGGIFDHLDVLEKGWGWKRLLPYIGCHEWSSYKNYLKQHYGNNLKAPVTQACLNEKVASAAGIGNIDGIGQTAPCSNGNRYVTDWRKEQQACTAGNGAGAGTGLAPLVKMCLDTEEKFIFESQQQGLRGEASHHTILSGEIKKCALNLMKLEGEYPVAAAALMFIMRSAELMCLLLRRGTLRPKFMVKVRQYALNLMMYRGPEYACAAGVILVCASLGTLRPKFMVKVRQYALNLMMYRGPEYACAAGVILGIAEETEKIYKCLKQGESISKLYWSKVFMENGWDVLEMLHDEFCCAGNLSRINDKNPNKNKKSSGSRKCRLRDR